MRLDDHARTMLAAAPLLRLVVLAGQVVTQRWSRIMNEQHGLTVAGANALLVLAGGGLDRNPAGPGRATHAELARRCWVRPATLTGVIDTLERGGLVRRERDAVDRRVVWLALTDEGWIRVRQIGAEVSRSLLPVATVPDPEKDALIRAFLIDLITYNEERGDGVELDYESGGRCARPGQALPET
jgi:DNA-binding MarR family transcriptional regulator